MLTGYQLVKPTDKITANHPGATPTSPVVWPAGRNTENKIQQTRVTSQPQATFALPTTMPSTPIVPPNTTPAAVSQVRVITRKAVNGQKTVYVQFTHPSNNPYFQGASVYLKKAGGQPTQVASGNKSPLTFTVPVNSAPHAIHVTSFGPSGETNILTAPSRPVRLK
jgi:hypothetical protein